MQTVGTAQIAFWGLALGIMAVAVGHAVRGWRRAKSGDLEAHRREMVRACLWIVVFLVIYLGKVAWLGHEDLAAWSRSRRFVVNVHRSIVFTMLALGGVARWMGPRALRRGGRLKNVHRWIGRGALVAGIFGLATAAMVFAQMIVAAW